MAILEAPIASDDPLPAETTPAKPTSDDEQPLPLHAITFTKPSDMMRFKAEINGHIINVFMDCGSSMNFLNPNVAARLGLLTTAADHRRFTAATG